MSDEQLNKILDKLLEEYSNLTTNVRKDVESLRSSFIELKVIVEGHIEVIKSLKEQLKDQKKDTNQWMQKLILILLSMLGALIGLKEYVKANLP